MIKEIKADMFKTMVSINKTLDSTGPGLSRNAMKVCNVLASCKLQEQYDAAVSWVQGMKPSFLEEGEKEAILKSLEGVEGARKVIKYYS